MTPLVLVTGGTGKTGRRVADQLAAAGAEARIAARGGPQPFDWSDPDTWAAALEGVSAAYIVPPPRAGDVTAAMTAFLGAAAAGGVRRFVLLSGSPISEGGPGAGRIHHWLRENAADWTVLRPSWFMQNFSEGQHLATIRNEGAIQSATGDGRVPFINADDIAACAVAALTRREPLNRDVVLTGPTAITYDAVARGISEASGRPVAHRRLGAEALAAWYRTIGVPDPAAPMLAMADVMIAGGAEDRVTDGVLELTGRPPTDFQAFARANAAVWRA